MLLLGNSTSMLGVAIFGVIVLCVILKMLIFWKAKPIKKWNSYEHRLYLKTSGIVNYCNFQKVHTE